jgi:hypothetical protein
MCYIVVKHQNDNAKKIYKKNAKIAQVRTKFCKLTLVTLVACRRS